MKNVRSRKAQGTGSAGRAGNFVTGIPDEAFIRGKVPMTKGEVRQVSLCSLRLQKDSVLYDIGSGTGSIAVEAAHLSKESKSMPLKRKKRR